MVTKDDLREALKATQHAHNRTRSELVRALEEIERYRKTLRVLASHEPSWSDDFLRARAVLSE